MADDLKIQVSAPGAALTEQELQRLADAELRVALATEGVGKASAQAAGGADKLAASNKTASEVSAQFNARNVTLLNSVRMLGPEFNIAAGALNQLINRTTTAGMALGMLGVAIGAASYAISKYNEYQAEQKKRAQEVLVEMLKQRDAYLEIAEAVSKAALAEQDRQTLFVAPVAADIKRAAEVGVGGEAQIKAAATLMAVGEILSDSDIETLMLWYTLEYGKGMSPGEARREFLGQKARDPNLKATLQKQYDAWKLRAPEVVAQYVGQRAEVRGGQRPEAMAEKTLQQFAEMEGKGRKPEDVRKDIARSLRIVEDPRYAVDELSPSQARENLESLLAKYPQLSELVIKGKRVGDVLGIKPPAAPPEIIEIPPRLPPLPPLPKMEKERREIVEREEFEKEEKRLIEETRTKMGVPSTRGDGGSPAISYSGGTHYHQNDRTDPAGKARPPRGQ